MYDELFRQLDTNNVELSQIAQYYWSKLHAALDTSVNHAENGNQLGVTMTVGVAREMVEALEALFRTGVPMENVVKSVDNK